MVVGVVHKSGAALERKFRLVENAVRGRDDAMLTRPAVPTLLVACLPTVHALDGTVIKFALAP